MFIFPLAIPAAALTGLWLFWAWYEQDLRDWRRIDWLFPLRGRWLRRSLMLSLGFVLFLEFTCLALWVVLWLRSIFA